MVLATGGGAFVEPRTRAEIAARATSVWIRADLDLLWDRVRDRPGRPLLQAPDPRAVLADLERRRAPVYAEADITVDSRRGASHEAMAREIVAAVRAHGRACPSAPTLEPRAMIETVTVPLGARAYDIRIGAGLIARAGAEIAPLLRRPRVAIVTEARVAALHLRRCVPASPTPGSRGGARARARRGDQGLGGAAARRRMADRRAGRPRRSGARLRRRGDRRSRRLRRGDPAPRRRTGADPDDAARPGRQLGRRQDRDQLAAGQEPGRRLPPAAAGAGGHGTARHPARRATFSPATPRW